jgi:hypothetical protein
LHGNYKDLPRKLIRYKQQKVYSIIERIRSRSYPISYLLGFPPTKNLPISREEKKFLSIRYQSIDNLYCEIANTNITKINIKKEKAYIMPGVFM